MAAHSTQTHGLNLEYLGPYHLVQVELIVVQECVDLLDEFLKRILLVVEHVGTIAAMCFASECVASNCGRRPVPVSLDVGWSGLVLNGCHVPILHPVVEGLLEKRLSGRLVFELSQVVTSWRTVEPACVGNQSVLVLL